MAARVAGGAARWRRLPSVHVWRWMRILAGIALLAIAPLGGALRVPLGYLIGHQHRLAEVAVACALFEGVLLPVVLLLSVDRERPRAQDRSRF